VLVGAVPSWLMFSWILSDGTWNPFLRRFSSNFFDVQAQSLLHGTFAMPANVRGIEGFASHGNHEIWCRRTILDRLRRTMPHPYRLRELSSLRLFNLHDLP
jgi:hypothetical protein